MEIVPVLVWIFTGLLLLLVVACVMAGHGAIPLNHFFGVRIPALMRNEAAWRAGHAAARVPAVVAFVLALLCSALGMIAPAAYIGTFIAFIGGVVWVGFTASKAARESSPL